MEVLTITAQEVLVFENQMDLLKLCGAYVISLESHSRYHHPFVGHTRPLVWIENRLICAGVKQTNASAEVKP